jgi:hypothetical protein
MRESELSTQATLNASLLGDIIAPISRSLLDIIPEKGDIIL